MCPLTKGAGVGPLRCQTSKGAEREEETEIKSLRDVELGEVGRKERRESAEKKYNNFHIICLKSGSSGDTPR